MSYTLQFICDGKDIHNPSEAEIRTALKSHTDYFGPVFALRLNGTDDFFAVIAEQDGHFSFQYGHDKQLVYASKKENFSVEDGVKAALDYLRGSPDWEKFGDWKELEQ